MKITPPLAPRRKSRRKSALHTPDPWSWLEDIEDPQTLTYLHAENTYYENFMKPFALEKERLFQLLRLRTAEDDNSIPERDGDYWYYVRYAKGLQYPLYCRKHLELTNPELVYLDHNQLAKDLDFCDIGFADVNVEHKILAYAIDMTGEERYSIFFKDLETDQLLSDKIDSAAACFEWKTKDSFFYVKLDEHSRPSSVFYHRLGQDPSDDRLIYHEKDSGFFVSLDASENDEYIFIAVHGYHASETYAHAVTSEQLEFHLIAEREDHHEYEVTHHGEKFYILTNRNADNFRIMTTSVSQPRPEHWEEFLAYEPQILTEGIMTFEKFFIILERHHSIPRIRVVTPDLATNFILEHEAEAFEIGLVGGRDFEAEAFRYWYSSPSTPQILYEYNVFTSERKILKHREIPDREFSPENYTLKRLWAPSRDGKNIPITLLYRTDLHRKTPQALLLHGYGSYGEILECDFNQYRITLVDQGYIFAMAHIRGGMDLGREWYLEGKLDKKWNSFYDFIDASEFLIAEGWTSPAHLVAEGASAGGLLMGVIANERPDLYCGILASVPFVDVINTMLDPLQPLTTLEYFEWGNPNEPRALELMRSYSPYDNVKAQTYPHMLVIAGLHDQRVMYWEASKWVAKLRHTKRGDNILLFKIEMNSGHGGASGRYDALEELAEELNFLVMLKNTKMPQL